MANDETKQLSDDDAEKCPVCGSRPKNRWDFMTKVAEDFFAAVICVAILAFLYGIFH